MEEQKEFYTTKREGNSSFIVQRCSNSRGRCLAVAEYGGGGRRNFIFVPEEEGNGWNKMGEALWDLSDGKRKVQRDSNQKRMMIKAQPQNLSYREALMVEQPRAKRNENEGKLVQLGKARGKAPVRETCIVQSEVGRVSDGETLKMLWEAKSQIEDLRMTIELLIEKEMGQDYNGPGVGLEGGVNLA